MNLFKDLLKYNKFRTYDFAKERQDQRLNVGNQYMDERFLNKMVSKHIVRNNILRDFMKFLDDSFFNIISGVRRVKAYKNFTIKKDDKYIR